MASTFIFSGLLEFSLPVCSFLLVRKSSATAHVEFREHAGEERRGSGGGEGQTEGGVGEKWGSDRDMQTSYLNQTRAEYHEQRFDHICNSSTTCVIKVCDGHDVNEPRTPDRVSNYVKGDKT